MALRRPGLTLTFLKNAASRVRRPPYRHVTLSSTDVKPLTITQGGDHDPFRQQHLLTALTVSLIEEIWEAKECLMDMVGTFYKAGAGSFAIEKQEKMLPVKSNQEECPVRHMKDSYQEVIIPLGQKSAVREKYLSFLKGLRFGRLLEDLDTFAVWICYIHNQDPSKGHILKSPLSTVTALVDRIDLHDQPISPFKDVKMCGHITWVGRSSMEVTMTVEQEADGAMLQMLTARFVMVSQNPETNKAAVVNPLEPVGEQELAMFERGKRSKAIRQEKASTSLLKTVPSEEERHLIHNIFLETIDQSSGTFSIRVKPANSVWMEETKLKNLSICHPEQKNIYNKIFGGFLMRQAFELAWANAALFCGNRPAVRVVDDIIFRKPVEVGSLLFFSSQIVYTEGSLMQVKVHAEVLDILTRSRETTNEFYFVFDSKQPNLPRVVPRTYAESMLYVDGRRHMTD